METAKSKDTDKIVAAYLRYLRLECNYSANTLDAYKHDIDKLTTFLAGNGLTVSDVSLDDLHYFAAGLHEIGIGPSSQCRILAGIRSFFNFLMLDGYRPDDPSELLENPQTGDRIPEVLSTEEVDMLERSIDLSVKEGQRNKAIIEVLFYGTH